ncbi:Hha toxicity attenuator [Klebsiella pneumoniae]|nr:Hha toxicity attenuator [Klebsiella pneumoniae]
MAHDVPLGCAPDEYDDLISGTCSHLPKLIAQVDEYLDDTFTLFSNYGINSTDLQKWKKSGNRLFRCFVNASRENPASLSC